MFTGVCLFITAFKVYIYNLNHISQFYQPHNYDLCVHFYTKFFWNSLISPTLWTFTVVTIVTSFEKLLELFGFTIEIRFTKKSLHYGEWHIKQNGLKLISIYTGLHIQCLSKWSQDIFTNNKLFVFDMWHVSPYTLCKQNKHWIFTDDSLKGRYNTTMILTVISNV